MQSNIFLREVIADQKTGHITLHVQTETEHEGAKWIGPLKLYGVCADTFHHRFQGDIDQMLQWVAQQHMGITGVHLSLVEELTARKGQKIG